MTVRVPTFSKVYSSDGGIDAIIITWAGLLNGDTGQPVQRPAMADKTMQVTGTFGAGGSATLQGSNDGANYAALTDPQGTVIAITSAGIKQITESTLLIRPNVTAGDGTTSLTATVVARRSIR